MSQKTDLQATNADLQAILNLVNSLPDKVEAPTYTIASLHIRIAASLATLMILQVESDNVSVTTHDVSHYGFDSEPFNILAGSLIYLEWDGDFEVSNAENVSIIYSGDNCVLAKATGTYTVIGCNAIMDEGLPEI